MKHSIFLIAAVFLAVATSSASAQNARAIGVEHADGRISYTYLQPGGGFWTHLFTRVAGMDTSRDGLPLLALQVRHVIDGAQVLAKVSLLYGSLISSSPHQRVVEVDTVLVNPGQTVRVESLTTVGLEPIRIWIADVPPAVVTLPEIETTSGRLAVRIETIAGAIPAFRVTLTNQSAMVLRSFRVQTYRTGEPSASRGFGGAGESPLVQPGATYTFDWRPLIRSTRQGTPEWLLPDRVVIEPKIWSDK